MFTRHWGAVLTIGLALSLAILAAVLVYNRANQAEIIYEHEADQYANTERHTERVHADRRCAHISSPERRLCIDDERHKARERERQERDLQAQLVTSAWTRAMGEAALIGMIVGIIGVGLIYTTFRESRRSANAASEQVGIMTEARRPDLYIGHLTYQRKVSETGTKHLFVPATDGFVTLEFVDRNNAVIHPQQSRYGWAVDDALPQAPVYDQEIVHRVGRSALSYSINLPLTDEQVASVKEGRTHLWVWAKLEVLDVYGTKHVVGLAARWISADTAPMDGGFHIGNTWQAVLDNPAYWYRKREQPKDEA